MSWSICHLSGVVVKYIRKNKKYVVGRLSGDIVVNEKSVSRKHAEIYLDSNNECLYIKDYSKFGTFVNQVSILQTESNIVDGDIVQIGCQPGVNFKISRKTLNIKKHNLTKHDSEVLNSCLEDVGGQIVNTLNGSTDVMVVSELYMNYQLAIAISRQKPIVTVQYFLQLVDFYDGILDEKPEYSSFIPVSNDNRISPKIFECIRTDIFANYTFYILSPLDTCPELFELINNCSGTLIHLANINSKAINQLILRNVCFVVLKKDLEKHNDKLKSISLIYSKLDKRMILEEEVIAASIIGSLNTYANPNKECDESFLKEYETIEQCVNLLPYNGLYTSADDILKILENSRTEINTETSDISLKKEDQLCIETVQTEIKAENIDSVLKNENHFQKQTSDNQTNQVAFKYNLEPVTLQNKITDNITQLNTEVLSEITGDIVNTTKQNSRSAQLWEKGITFKKDDSPNTKLSKLDKMLTDLEVPQFLVDPTKLARVQKCKLNSIFPGATTSVPKEIVDCTESSADKENVPVSLEENNSPKIIPAVEVVPTKPVVKEAFSSFNVPSKSSKNVATLDLMVKPTTTTTFQSVPKTKKFVKVQSTADKPAISLKPHNS